MVRGSYIPERGDIVWLDFDPQSGREQTGHGPALVLSPKGYNLKVGLAVCCPLTTRIKGYPFEVLVKEAGSGAAAVLADHVKNLDWRARRARFKAKAPRAVVTEVQAKLYALLLD